MEWAPLLTAFTLGLLSSAHCVGMCGGIMGALTMAIPKERAAQKKWLIGSYNLGRVASYTFMGLLAMFFADAFHAVSGASLLRIFSGLILIAMGFYLANWWRGLTYLEQGGRYLWAYLQPLSKHLLPVTTNTQALMLGALWGWLPCGLVYTALIYAMSQANLAPWIMLSFGLGTLPAVVASGLVAGALSQFLQQRGVRTLLALLIIAFGVWTLLAVVAHRGHGDHGAHQTAPHTHEQSSTHEGGEHQHLHK